MHARQKRRCRALTLLLGLGSVLFTGKLQVLPSSVDQLCIVVPVRVRNSCTCMSVPLLGLLYRAMAFSIIHVAFVLGTAASVKVLPCMPKGLGYLNVSGT